MLPLGAYLLKPVQRVLKYSLLLEVSVCMSWCMQYMWYNGPHQYMVLLAEVDRWSCWRLVLYGTSHITLSHTHKLVYNKIIKGLWSCFAQEYSGEQNRCHTHITYFYYEQVCVTCLSVVPTR